MKSKIHILLAEDDEDDYYSFRNALQKSSVPTQLTIADTGEKLLDYLKDHSNLLPDILFMDINLPRKNGFECLKEIKEHEKMKALPIIVYSTSLHEDVADYLFDKGVHYFIKKTDNGDLEKILHKALTALLEKEFVQPPRNHFILNASNTPSNN